MKHRRRQKRRSLAHQLRVIRGRSPHSPMHRHLRYIPQGSPPNTHTNRQVPLYYRDCIDPRVAPSYNFICHSAWYVQLDEDYILCNNCITSELFCMATQRSIVWKHIHLIARNYYHTTLHCGNCYKLLLKTRRSTECLHCRSYVLTNYSNIERVVYNVLCDLILPYN